MEQHTQYIIPVLITVVMDDGSEEEFDPGGHYCSFAWS
jgi:hypothetical protein